MPLSVFDRDSGHIAGQNTVPEWQEKIISLSSQTKQCLLSIEFSGHSCAFMTCEMVVIYKGIL